MQRESLQGDVITTHLLLMENLTTVSINEILKKIVWLAGLFLPKYVGAMDNYNR